MKSTILALLLAFAAAPLQNLPPSTPRDGAKQLIDNNRVAVWDVTLEKGKPTAMHEHRWSTELAGSPPGFPERAS